MVEAFSNLTVVSPFGGKPQELLAEPMGTKFFLVATLEAGADFRGEREYMWVYFIMSSKFIDLLILLGD